MKTLWANLMSSKFGLSWSARSLMNSFKCQCLSWKIYHHNLVTTTTKLRIGIFSEQETQIGRLVNGLRSFNLYIKKFRNIIKQVMNGNDFQYVGNWRWLSSFFHGEQLETDGHPAIRLKADHRNNTFFGGRCSGDGEITIGGKYARNSRKTLKPQTEPFRNTSLVCDKKMYVKQFLFEICIFITFRTMKYESTTETCLKLRG